MRKLAHITRSPALHESLRERNLGLAAIVVLVLILGYNLVVIKVALQYSDAFSFAAMRTFFGALSLLTLLLILRRPLKPKAIGLTLIVGLLQTSGFIGLLTWALVNGGVGKTSALTYLMPFWLILLCWVLLGERLRGVQWLALALAFVGLMLVLAPWRLQGVFSSLLAVGGGFCWAASGIFLKILHQRHRVDLLSLTAWQMLFGSIPLVAIAFMTSENSPVWSAPLTYTLIYNALPANALAWFLWIYALRVLPSPSAGLGTLAIPVLGTIAAWIQLGESPLPAEALGMVLIVSGLALISAREVVTARRHLTQKTPLAAVAKDEGRD